MPAFDPYLEWLAIPPEEQPPHHYRLLGLREFEADPQLIQAAADRQMTYLQSCAAGEHVVDSQRLLNAVAAARSCLLNPQRKAAYDRRLRAELAAPPRVVSRAVPVPAAIQTAGAAATGRRDHQILATVAAIVLGGATAFVAWLAIQGGFNAGVEDIPVAAPRLQARAGDDQPADVVLADAENPAVPAAERIPPEAPPPQVDPEIVIPPAGVGDAPIPLLNADGEAAGVPAVQDDFAVDDGAGEPAGAEPLEAALPGPLGAAENPDANDAARENPPQPLPDPDAQQRALAEIRRIFADEFANARSPSEKAALAAKLLEDARGTRDNPAAEYVLFEQSLKLAIESADPSQAQKTIDAMARAFEIDAFEAKVTAFAEISRSARSLTDRQSLVDSALAVADAAVEAGEFDAAHELANLAYSVAARVRDADLRAEAGERRDAIRERRQEWADAQAARETLDRHPDDAAANETLGLYLCFVEGDWSQGLPYLAKADDADLRAIAAQELAAGETPSVEVQAALGDAWFALAEAAARSRRAEYGVRAGDWYRGALEGLTGLEQARVEKQIEELDRQALRDANAAGRRVAGARAAAGMIGRCLVDNVDAGLILTYQPGQFVHDDSVRTVLGKQGIVGGAVRIELHGVLEIPRSMELAITHIGGSSNSGVARLYLNNRELGAVGDNRSKSTVYTLALPKGLYAVRWLLSGGDLGACDIEFADAGRDEAVPVYYTNDMLNRLRRLPTNAEASLSSEGAE